ncbi:LANO_0A00584g1_1 [Lachancea nothofagi CBS 11611]|uniref:LANO_0A00584g1_1 n=1 Tax=Lachancea nothofagi CBS 11611 TaxID=1266666 RepID=A0A1G4IMC2_9SACH|nr:LANO_0A00584g1_1 [Lachancea nothofagi CBS 11611]
MSSTVSQKPTKFWSKVKSSTKSFSSSFAQLSIKQERDGDTPTTTVVHKALVKFYSHQEPFQGFPDWLGHKEELPDEQKILRKHKDHHHDPRAPAKAHTAETETSRTQPVSPAATARPTAGTDFRGIYKSSLGSRVAHSSSAPPSSVPVSSDTSMSSRAPPPTQRTSSMLMRERLKRK